MLRIADVECGWWREAAAAADDKRDQVGRHRCQEEDSRDPRQSDVAHQFPLYDLLKPLRALVTVNDPSDCADTLIQNAGPL